MGPPRLRAGTLAGGRGVGAGRGAGGARGVGRHGWRMASLLSTLPLPLVTAPPPPPAARYPHLRVTVFGATSSGCLCLLPPTLPPSARIPAPRPRGRPCRRGFACRGCARVVPFAGLRARGAVARPRPRPLPGSRFPVSLPRAPLSRYSAPPTGARAQFASRRESAPQGLLGSRPHLQALPPPPCRPFHDFLRPPPPPPRASSFRI